MSIEGIAYDATEFRFYTVALVALQLYDYWLTLADEIQYAWEGRNRVFCLFLFNRYVPIIYQLWSLFSTFWVGYSQTMCNHTAFIHMLICVVFTLMVQVLLTVRVYAITMKHRVITGFFLIATVFQSGLGIFMTYLAARYSAHPVLEPDFPDGHLCIYNEHRTEEVVYTILSLIFDVAVFILIMTRLLWRRPPSVRIPSIIRTIVKDATLYVLLLCTSRIIFVFLSIFAAGLGHITRFSGNNVFVSIMITRMLISLKKTSAKGLGQGWVLDEKDDSILDPSGSLRVVRDGALSSSHTSHNQLDSVIPIHMEVIHVRGERFHN